MVFLANFLNILGLISIIITLYKVVMMGREEKRMNERVDIVFRLKEKGQQISSGLCLRRRHVTRSETLGIMGMMTRGGERFKSEHTGQIAFLDSLDKVHAGKDKALVIPVSLDELKQFILPDGTVREQAE